MIGGVMPLGNWRRTACPVAVICATPVSTEAPHKRTNREIPPRERRFSHSKRIPGASCLKSSLLLTARSQDEGRHTHPDQHHPQDVDLKPEGHERRQRHEK